MIIFSTFSLQLVQAEALIDERKVGMLNVAVSEFTVQGEIPAQISQKFSNQSLKELELALIDRLRQVAGSQKGIEESMTEVFDIRFSFYNKDMLELLEKRAKVLRSAQVEKVKAIEAQMSKLTLDKFRTLRCPNTFFCTFENSKTSQKLLDMQSFDFLGSSIKLK